MMKTPPQSESFKPNPYITKSTSKSLLTPCRCVGLPRPKKKTPLGSSELQDDSVQTTPISSMNITKSINKGLLGPCPRLGLPRPNKKTPLGSSELQDDSVQTTPNSSLNITKSISKSLFGPCPRLGLSRPNKKTPLCSSELQDGSVQTTPNSSLNMTKTISKSLLGPCPRVGLSRSTKKTTSNSSLDVTKSTSKSLLSSCGPVGLSRKRTTPNVSAHKDSSKEKTPVGLLEQLNASEKISSASNTFKVGLTEQKTTSSTSIYENSAHLDKTPISSLQDTVQETGDKNATLKTVEKKSKVAKCLILDESTSEEIESEEKLQIDLDVQKEIEHMNVSPVEAEFSRTKKISKRFISDDEDFEEPQNLRKKKCYDSKNKKKISSEALQDVTNQDVRSNSDGLIENLINETRTLPKRIDKTKKIKRSLSTKKSSTEEKSFSSKTPILRECSITLSPLNVNKEQEDFDMISELASIELKDLEKQVKEKRQLVVELKQAEIIKNKHDVKELQQLTTLWKSGSISALNDLLPLLQRNVNLDMKTLLKNLNIPPEMISLTENGDLV